MSQTTEDQPTNAELVAAVTGAVSAVQDAETTVVNATKNLTAHLSDPNAHGAETKANIEAAVPKPIWAGTRLSFASDNGSIATTSVELKGEKGDKGDKGDRGYTGATGSTGATGATGAKGDKGDTGATGEQGIQGEIGAAGAQGEQGIQGETGATGYNAYQVAQVNGFNGTITEWLASLKGDMGNTGMTGATGFSAYDVAVGNGFEGSITQWLASLKGTNGTNGISKEVMDAADTYILNEAKTYVNQVGQQTLNQANAYTDSRVNALNRDMRKLEDRTYAAVASSIAIASLPQPTDAGYNMFSAGVGTWEGEQGYAFGLSGVTESNKYVYKVAVTTNSEGDFGAGAAIGWQWK